MRWQAKDGTSLIRLESDIPFMKEMTIVKLMNISSDRSAVCKKEEWIRE